MFCWSSSTLGTNLLGVMGEPHSGVEPRSKLSQDFVLAGFEGITEPYRMVTASTVSIQAFLVDVLRGGVWNGRHGKATRKAGLPGPAGPS